MSFLVTGASSGIGRAVAFALAAQEQEVIAVARRGSELNALKSHYPDLIRTVQADVATEAGRSEIIDSVNLLDALHGVVHAAGTTVRPEAYSALNTNELLSHMNVHVMAPIALNNQLISKLNNARVVYIDSFSAAQPRPGWVGYSMVKAAAQMAAKSAAVEATAYRVIRLFPGAVATPLVDEVLNAAKISETVKLFKRLRDNNELVQPERVGDYVTSILLHASDAQLDTREYWDFTCDDFTAQKS